jgi:hypothetical protein
MEQIQLTSATVELVLAPEERDVYSYQRTPKDFAPLGAKPGSATCRGRQIQLRSFGASSHEKNRPAINISPRWGETAKTISVAVPT